MINEAIQTNADFLSYIGTCGIIPLIWGIVQITQGFRSKDNGEMVKGIVFCVAAIIMVAIKPIMTGVFG